MIMKRRQHLAILICALSTLWEAKAFLADCSPFRGTIETTKNENYNHFSHRPYGPYGRHKHASTIPPTLLRSSDSSSSDWNDSELTKRLETLQQAEQAAPRRFLQLPVICMDALLPGQRLHGTTTDPVLGHLLQHDVGLGGLLVMTSLNQKRRMLRRNGVVVQVEYLDVPTAASTTTGKFSPTAVEFVIRGVRPGRVVGPIEGLQARTGRWRRDYDPDGEEARLGFGTERYVDAQAKTAATEHVQMTSDDENDSVNDPPPIKSLNDKTSDASLHYTQPSLLWLDCAWKDEDDQDPMVLNYVSSVLSPLLDQWYELASNPATYENTNVVATARIQRGQPGLRVDPAALLRRTQQDLGPPPQTGGTAWALYGAALINPVPTPLGVAPEIRGRILEAPNARQRLQILEWGLKRSVDNLLGIAPLM